MADNRRSRIEILDQDDESYELDLDSDTSLDEALEDATKAVDQAAGREPGVEDDEEAVAEAEDRSPAADDHQQRIQKLEEELRQARDRHMRALADFDNFRKRAEREKESLRRYAIFDPLRAFLDVVDNIDRAMDASGGVDDIKQGLAMTRRGLDDLLTKLDVEPIAAVGEAFDPTVHEAVMREESSAVTVPTVTAELQKGYLLHDRLLRPAMVQVAMPAAGAAPSAAEETADADAAEEAGGDAAEE